MTFFELAHYSKGVVDQDRMLWNHTATVMALFANSNRDPKRRPTPYQPSDFHPYEDQTKNPDAISEEQIQSIAKWHVNPSSQ